MDPKSLEEALEDARRARQEALSLSLDLEALAGQMKTGRSLDEQVAQEQAQSAQEGQTAEAGAGDAAAA